MFTYSFLFAQYSDNYKKYQKEGKVDYLMKAKDFASKLLEYNKSEGIGYTRLPETILRKLDTEIIKSGFEKIGVSSQRWKFCLDEADKGGEKGWYKTGYDDSGWEEIETGKTWESQGYDYDGYAWYRKWVDVPDKLKGKEVQLYFGAVDGAAWVYLNGEFLGEHKGWDEPFILEASSLKPGQRNLLAVRVYDGSGSGGIYKKVEWLVQQD